MCDRPLRKLLEVGDPVGPPALAASRQHECVLPAQPQPLLAVPMQIPILRELTIGPNWRGGSALASRARMPKLMLQGNQKFHGGPLRLDRHRGEAQRLIAPSGGDQDL